jgi:hypothetical protein
MKRLFVPTFLPVNRQIYIRIVTEKECRFCQILVKLAPFV